MAAEKIKFTVGFAAEYLSGKYVPIADKWGFRRLEEQPYKDRVGYDDTEMWLDLDDLEQLADEFNNKLVIDFKNYLVVIYNDYID
jgi:hypothetical protein